MKNEEKGNYCLDAYEFNCYILQLIGHIKDKNNKSKALIFYTQFKNNLLNVLDYITEIKIEVSGPVSEKVYLLNFISVLHFYIKSEKQIKEFRRKLTKIKAYFSDTENADQLISVLKNRHIYYYEEFDDSYELLSSILSNMQMSKREMEKESFLEKRYKNLISIIHCMEGFTLEFINSKIKNESHDSFIDYAFFYLGIPFNISRNNLSFYFFEYKLMYKLLDQDELENYIINLHQVEHLEIMQCTYTLSKVKKLKKQTIQKLVVTNPYTNGLKKLMLAQICDKQEEIIEHYENALKALFHIKYYYLESLFYFANYLRDVDVNRFTKIVNEGLELSQKFYYQYLTFLFKNIELQTKPSYPFSYTFYPIKGLEEYVEEHNKRWEERFENEFN